MKNKYNIPQETYEAIAREIAKKVLTCQGCRYLRMREDDNYECALCNVNIIYLVRCGDTI